jgi:hypothetical protein
MAKFVCKVILVLLDVCDSDSKRQGSCLCFRNGQFFQNLSTQYFQFNSKSTFLTKLIFKDFLAQYYFDATLSLKADFGELVLMDY